MIEMIKEMGIFIVIAQAIIYFVPSENYVKYVKVIVGILMIAKVAGPILSFDCAEAIEEILESGSMFAMEMEEMAEQSFEDMDR